MQTYVYIVAATKEGKRDHNEANAERVRFSLENLVQPAFLAKKENAQTRQGALEQAEVLVICADASSDMNQTLVAEAVEAFSKKENGRIFVYGKSKSAAEQVDGAQFVREKSNGMDVLLRKVLNMDDEEELDEFELARKMQEQMQEQQDEQEHKSNLGNILWICGFIAAVCLLFRLVLWMRG